jgi:4-hydroxy-4-methyl-2-oxoglutarate aldolase
MPDDRPITWPSLPLSIPFDFPRVPEDLLAAVRALPGAATTCSDLLDGLGLALAIPADTIRPRITPGVVAGHVLTGAYLPERRAVSYPNLSEVSRGLMHDRLTGTARPGDVLVLDARGSEGVSLLGGLAAATLRRRGIAACIVDGGVRDMDEIREVGLAVWSRSLTPRTGRWRVEAFSFNLPVACGGVQVLPGDVAVADETGVCFLPNSLAEETLRRLLEISAAERTERTSALGKRSS